jgi:cobyrinic acid a,c-diamide synthase
MYLGRHLQVGGNTYPMVQALPLDFQLRKRPQGHGYTRFEVVETNPFYPIGTMLKGHEFHYSRAINCDPAHVSLAFAMRRGTGILDERDGVCYKNVLATYSHVHAIGAPEWAEGLVRKAMAHQRESASKCENLKSNLDNRTANTGIGDGVR